MSLLLLLWPLWLTRRPEAHSPLWARRSLILLITGLIIRYLAWRCTASLNLESPASTALSLVLGWLGHRKLAAINVAAAASHTVPLRAPSRSFRISVFCSVLARSDGGGGGGHATDLMLLRAGFATAALFLAVLVPIYAATPSVMSCRRWWRVTAAYLPPWSVEAPAAWTVVVAAVCGVGVTAGGVTPRDG